jgi:hypothetical protein
MRIRSVKIGNRYGELEVVGYEDDHIEPNGHKRQVVKVRCSCGREYKVEACDLTKGRKNRCGKCGRESTRVCRIGAKYDRLTVCEYVMNDGKTMVVCRCDCGVENILGYPTDLIKSGPHNCGCEPHHPSSWGGVGGISRTLFHRIQREAKIREIEFDLTIEYLWKLFLTQDKKCALSGETIDFGFKRADSNTASLDRIDSDGGYIVGNVQWLHKDVNQMKIDFDEQRFLELCKLVAQYDQSRL